MSEHCPQDGGFIGDAGCTHPNHQHSELVKGIMSGKVSSVSEEDATAANGNPSTVVNYTTNF